MEGMSDVCLNLNLSKISPRFKHDFRTTDKKIKNLLESDAKKLFTTENQLGCNLVPLSKYSKIGFVFKLYNKSNAVNGHFNRVLPPGVAKLI